MDLRQCRAAKEQNCCAIPRDSEHGRQKGDSAARLAPFGDANCARASRPAAGSPQMARS
eukprot:CAMPEP_0184397992 /NCGR_PEP_ID=MMETSP0007-20130409/63532_1 /TAXON_ID=97485 /ORGANISM="Prymnesium parvum, Strain Texoma1" /LENGTH=58 /DNA_ID=CAMNT_0026751719 /DNA_START=1 /DNA_END=174 /DNA_ORIENTATION=+